MGSLAALFYVVIVGYSVLQHRLLDIHVTLSRFAAQFVRLVFMFLIGFCLLLVIVHFAPEGSFTQTSFAAAIGVLLASAVVASLLFPQFFGKGTTNWSAESWATALNTTPKSTASLKPSAPSGTAIGDAGVE